MRPRSTGCPCAARAPPALLLRWPAALAQERAQPPPLPAPRDLHRGQTFWLKDRLAGNAAERAAKYAEKGFALIPRPPGIPPADAPRNASEAPAPAPAEAPVEAPAPAPELQQP